MPSAKSRIAVLDVQPRLLSDALSRALQTSGWHVVGADPDNSAELKIVTTQTEGQPNVWAVASGLAVRIRSVAELELVLHGLSA